jgi:hypothetical protein
LLDSSEAEDMIWLRTRLTASAEHVVVDGKVESNDGTSEGTSKAESSSFETVDTDVMGI